MAGYGTGGAAGDVCPLCFWAQNLIGLSHTRVSLSIEGRVVYSHHAYGPGTDPKMHCFKKAAFPEFPANMSAIWREHFLAPAAGALLGTSRAAGATVVVAEWEGKYEVADREW